MKIQIKIHPQQNVDIQIKRVQKKVNREKSMKIQI